jgi:arylsulfatase A-like enzyme
MEKAGYQPVNYFSYEDKVVLKKSRDWLESQNKNQNKNQSKDQSKDQSKNTAFIASYLTGTSHHNYQTPSNFPSKSFHEDEKYNRYLNSIAYTDEFVKLLLDQYKQLGLLDDTLFVIVGDHGEGFDKSQSLMHNNNIYNSGLHIPLFFYSKDIEAETLNKPVSQSEIKSLIASLSSEENEYLSYLKASDPERPVISSCWYMDYCYSLIQNHEGNTYKLIDDRRNQRKLLFNLSQDPKEKNLINMGHENFLKEMSAKLEEGIEENILYHQQFFEEKNSGYLNEKQKAFSGFKAVKYPRQ